MSATVENWLGRLKQSPTHIKNARSQLNAFLKWLKENGGLFKDYTPDQLIEYQNKADNGSRYKLLDLLQRHILSLNARRSTKMTRYTKVRSFFMHNRADLPADKSFKIRGNLPKINGDLSLEETKKIILSSSPMYQAIFLSMLQGGMGSHEVLYWSNNGLKKLEEDLRDDRQIIKVELPGRKEGENERPFYTFIGGDAEAAVEKYLVERPKDVGDAIFITRTGKPIDYFSLQSYWRSRLLRLGIGPRSSKQCVRTGKGSHELRDLFRTQWAKSPAKPEIAEFQMGHIIDSLEYNKAWRDEKFYLDEYIKALPYLQIMSSGKPYHMVGEDEVESLRREIERLRYADEQELGEAKMENLEMYRRLENLEKLVADKKIFDSKSTEDLLVKTLRENAEMSSRLESLEILIRKLTAKP